MKEMITREVKKTVKETIECKITCDECKKVILEHHKEWVDHSNEVIDYYEVQTGHYDWGNDSIESMEEFHLCPDCLMTFVGKYKETATTARYRMNSRYCHIDHKWNYQGISRNEALFRLPFTCGEAEKE